MSSQPGKLLRLYVNERDEYHGKPLYQAIVARCQELNLGGVTVFRGLEGFGQSSELHRSHLVSSDQPIVITVVEGRERALEALPVLQAVLDSDVIAITEVEATLGPTGAPAP